MLLFPLLFRFRTDPRLEEQIKRMEEEVLVGRLAPGTAADILVDTFLQLRFNKKINHVDWEPKAPTMHHAPPQDSSTP